jgi:hypothetical protein
MKGNIELHVLLAQASDRQQKITSFALLCLGIIESLAGGLVSVNDAVRIFFHSENCLFVRENLKQKVADQIMSRGVQLPDLFDALSAEEAQREFQHELAAMHSLSLKLLEEQRVAA